MNMQWMQRIRAGWIAILLALATLPVLGGCGYTLRGKVVRGEVSSVEVVHQIDPRMKAPALANADVRVVRDANTPNRHQAGQDHSDGNGEFTMHLGEFGSGWMDEQWQVQALLTGFQNADTLTKLPAKGSKWILLITLAPGTSTPPPKNDEYMQDMEKFK